MVHEEPYTSKGSTQTLTHPSTQDESLEESVRKMQEQMQSLIEDVEWMREGIRVIIHRLDDDVEEESPDNYDMTPDQIRDLILEKVQVGEPFYASDIASKYGLDYDAVVTAIEQLRAKGKINDDV